ncbi:hypothetical protein GQ457_15G021340 [Hibiscus cannabinus]
MYKVTVDAEVGRRRREDSMLQSLAAMVAVDCSPIKETIQSGVVPRFVEFLAMDDFQQVQVLANISVESTTVVIYHGFVPLLVKLPESPRDDIREQVVWALRNVAGDLPISRDMVLGHGSLMPLLAQFNEHAKLSMLRTSTWTFSNFCKGKPLWSFEQQTRPTLLILECLICSSDEDVLSNACRALSKLSDGTNDKIKAVIEAGVCPRLVELLLHPSPAVVIDAAIIAPLVYLLRSSELEIKKEAASDILNATFSVLLEQIEFLVGQGFLILWDLLLCSDPRIVVIYLKALENILKASEARKKIGHSREANLYALLIDDVGGLEKIEILHVHGNNKIYEMAVKLHETYWVGVSCYPPMMLCNLVSSLEAINFLIHPMDSISVEVMDLSFCLSEAEAPLSVLRRIQISLALNYVYYNPLVK